MPKARVTEQGHTILDKIVQTMLPYKLVNFLNTRFLKTKYIDLNLWSIVHLLSGIIFFFIWLLFSKNLLLGFFVWFLIHTLWEILEFLLALKGIYPALFYEEVVDIVWDTIVSLFGYVLVWVIFY